jgi:hypothetical protein
MSKRPTHVKLTGKYAGGVPADFHQQEYAKMFSVIPETNRSGADHRELAGIIRASFRGDSV